MAANKSVLADVNVRKPIYLVQAYVNVLENASNLKILCAFSLITTL